MSFKTYGLSSELLRAINDQGYTNPTPIQQKAIPLILTGKDVVAGAETLLKTREFVYYSYYNRIKKRLKQHWEPRIQEKIVKILRKGRKIASVNDKITHLVITLDKHGELKRIQVKQASGYNDLDDAAIEAFRAAAPFPNPPKGIVTGAGEVQIPWSFVLETWYILIF